MRRREEATTLWIERGDDMLRRSGLRRDIAPKDVKMQGNFGRHAAARYYGGSTRRGSSTTQGYDSSDEDYNDFKDHKHRSKEYRRGQHQRQAYQDNSDFDEYQRRYPRRVRWNNDVFLDGDQH